MVVGGAHVIGHSDEDNAWIDGCRKDASPGLLMDASASTRY